MTVEELAITTAHVMYENGSPTTISCSGNGVRVLNIPNFEWSTNASGGNMTVTFGGDKPHENRQPYKTVYVFRRTI